MYLITPPAECFESSDSYEYFMLFCLPSSVFIFMPASLSLSVKSLNVLSSISAVDDYIINVDEAPLTDQSM